jgi:hypothetical protein
VSRQDGFFSPGIGLTPDGAQAYPCAWSLAMAPPFVGYRHRADRERGSPIKGAGARETVPFTETLLSDFCEKCARNSYPHGPNGCQAPRPCLLRAVPASPRNFLAIYPLLALCAAATLAGCFGSKVYPYPADWPPLVVDPLKPCDIAGVYSVKLIAAHELPRSSRTGEESAWGNLVDVIEEGMEGFPHVDHTLLRISQGRDDAGAFIDVFAEDASQVISTRRLREGAHFRCTEEGVEISRGWYYININVGVAFLKYRFVFHKDPNTGDLVLHSLTQERGLPLFVIPVWGSGESWSRWRAQESPGPWERNDE